jgi:flavin-dependent dehydrogenase
VDARDERPAVRYAFSEAFRARHDHAFQVPRDEFDALLFRRAGACGAELREGWEVTAVVHEGGRAVGVEARGEDGVTAKIAARFVVDASGRDAIVSRRAAAPQRIPDLDRTALFQQVRGAWRDTGEREGDIQIVCFGEGAERGWFWLIPFSDGRSSVGAVVSPAWLRARRHLGGPEALLPAAIEQAPVMARMLAGATPVFAPRAAADFSFRAGTIHGDGWLAAGDASGFLDPLFSTGAHLAMRSGLSAADAIDAILDDPGCAAARLSAWERELRAGADLFLGAVQAFYRGELLDAIFTQPQHPFLRRAITSMLSGDVFDQGPIWAREMRARFPARL